MDLFILPIYFDIALKYNFLLRVGVCQILEGARVSWVGKNRPTFQPWLKLENLICVTLKDKSVVWVEPMLCVLGDHWPHIFWKYQYWKYFQDLYAWRCRLFSIRYYVRLWRKCIVWYILHRFIISIWNRN